MRAIERLAGRLAACRQAGETVCLYPHVSVDGDALGSALALLLTLKTIGVRVYLPLEEAIPPKLDFMPALEHITQINGEAGDTVCQAAAGSLALLIDCSDASRLGKRQSLCEQADEHWVLDHHVAQRPLGDHDVVDTHAAAAAEIVYDLIRALEQLTDRPLLDRTQATLLMTAIVSDTGGFVYSNTTRRTFAIAADLMNDDIQLNEMTYRLFHRSSRSRLRLMGRIFSQAVFSCDNQIVMASVSQAMMQDCQATDDDLDGIIGHLRHVAGVELAVILRMRSDGEIRVNIRSGPSFDAARFAGLFGGGGHPRAAGLTLTGLSLDDATAFILQKAGELL